MPSGRFAARSRWISVRRSTALRPPTTTRPRVWSMALVCRVLRPSSSGSTAWSCSMVYPELVVVGAGAVAGAVVGVDGVGELGGRAGTPLWARVRPAPARPRVSRAPRVRVRRDLVMALTLPRAA
ncbi:hypothetical protein DFI_03345 [Deinococcus ficus]|uniref:Uncharacterized protein n=1 Tax=Deinococcus ficus TaxID=317577 RepID=A0A221SU73_9DEIO|nr:hypothetical protein DFI_03345 [Deinococcus ficus]